MPSIFGRLTNVNLWKKNPSIGVILVLIAIGRGGCQFYESKVMQLNGQIKSLEGRNQTLRDQVDTCQQARTLDAKEREQYEREVSRPYREAAERAVQEAMHKYISPKMDTIRNL